MSDKKLKYVDLVLEPVESYRLSAEDVLQLDLNDIHRDVHYELGNFSEALTCDEAVIDLKMSALQKVKTTQEDEDGNVLTLDRRLNYWKDFVAVDLIFDDKSHEYVYVPWGDADASDINAYMSTSLLENYADKKDQTFSMIFSPSFNDQKTTDGFDLDLTKHDDQDNKQ